MARKKKRPELANCKVRQQNHPTAPWRVSYKVQQDGKRVTKRKGFSDEDDAWAFAEERDLEITNHGLRYSDIPPEARRAFDFYRDKREEMEGEGIEVPAIEDLISDSLDSIRAEHDSRKASVVTVAEGVEMFLDYKRTRVGETQQADLRSRLTRFASDYGTHSMDEITMDQLGEWLIGLRNRKFQKGRKKSPLLAPRTRNHYRGTLSSLFAHGSKLGRGWCKRNPLEDIENEAVEESEPEAYSSEDAARLMQRALDEMPQLVPALALGMFCGLRVSEAKEIELAKVSLSSDEFRNPSKKTGPRMSPLTAAAASWLEAQPRRKGKAWEGASRQWDIEINQLCERARVKQIVNGARHSFISYRTAEIRDVAQVADECGNSPTTIRKYYRKIVTSEAANQFFSIRPEDDAENVTPINEGRVSA